MSEEPKATSGGVREVKSAARTVEILEFLAARQNRPVRLRELSAAIGVPRSSLHALLRTLAKHGWVRSDPTGTLYGIGIRALLTGTSYLDTDPYLPLVTPLLDELRSQLDETFHFGRLDGTDIVYLATRESSRYVRPVNRVGRRLPAYTTSLGKAALAAQPVDRLSRHLPDRLEPLTPHTIVDRDALLADLEATRTRGYAVDNEENLLGVHCVAVALRYLDPPTDAISASIPLSRLDEVGEARVIAAIQAAAERANLMIRQMAQATAWA